MNKNLIIAVVGDTSVHNSWITKDRDYDLFVVYYGDVANKYKSSADYYCQKKGTKINIIGDLTDEYMDVFEKYEYIFIPDDDLVMEVDDINRMFKIGKEYNLSLFQPSLIGYYSLVITLNVFDSILRYTNFVEIMCPCFSIEAFKICKDTFRYNKSCWGIDMLWNHTLENPKDKIAIIDDVIAIHTRACFNGDNYSNNNIVRPDKDIKDIVKKFNLTWEKITYDKVLKGDIEALDSTDRIIPNNKHIRDGCKSLYESKSVSNVKFF